MKESSRGLIEMLVMLQIRIGTPGEFACAFINSPLSVGLKISHNRVIM